MWHGRAMLRRMDETTLKDTARAGADSHWIECPGDEWSDALVASMKLGGIDHLFFVSGFELAFLPEAVVKAQALGRPAPRLMTMMHESVALNAAVGYSMLTGRPAATAVHIDVGKQPPEIRLASLTQSGAFDCGERS